MTGYHFRQGTKHGALSKFSYSCDCFWNLNWPSQEFGENAHPVCECFQYLESLHETHPHIQASLGLDNPRHIVYAPTSKLFGVGCVRTEPVQVGQDETVASSFKLLDDTTLGGTFTISHHSLFMLTHFFAVLAQVDLQADEHIMSLAVLDVTVNDKLQPLFCVGTTFLRNDEMEPSSGRILLFEPTQPSPTVTQLRRVASDNVSGCVYSLAVIDGMLAAAINSSVSLFPLNVLSRILLFVRFLCIE